MVINPTSSHVITEHHQGLHHSIRCLYGEATASEARRFDHLRKRRTRLLARLSFLLKCRDTNIIPTFLRVSRKNLSRRMNKTIIRTEQTLVRNAIQDTRSLLDGVSRELLSSHSSLAKRLAPEHFDLLDRITARSNESSRDHLARRHDKKLQRLTSKTAHSPTAADPLPTTVHNLSSKALTPSAISVLEKGFNFALAPTRIDKFDIISRIEASLWDVPKADADEIRFLSARILQKATPPSPNLSRAELKALHELRNDKDIVILPADKGNSTVVMDRSLYRQKMNAMLEDPVYQRLKSDPTSATLNRVKKLVKEMKELSDEDKKKLKSSDAVCPRIYGLPKRHKLGLPLRPIVSAIRSPTYALAKIMAKRLAPHTAKIASHVQNSRQFVEKLRPIRLQESDIMVSFDVVSLFTKVPIKRAIDSLRKLTSEETLSAVACCMSSTYFRFEGQFYKQVEGVPMGSPLSPVVTDIFMADFEEEAISTSSLKPSVWLRYVDDTFVIWPHGRDTLDLFLEHLNSRDPSIQFTMEVEENGMLPFLDVHVIRKPDGSLTFKVFRKKTHTDRYLNNRSHHAPNQKTGVLRTLISRAHGICDEEFVPEELEHLQKAFIRNGYDMASVQRAMNHTSQSVKPTERRKVVCLPYIHGVTDKIGRVLAQKNIAPVYLPATTIRQFLPSPKDNVPLSSSGVYLIPCATCDACYIGETGRTIHTRIEEHKRDVRLAKVTTSPVAQHVWEQNHVIDFDQVRTIARIDPYFQRIIREGLEIQNFPCPTLNRVKGMEVSGIWSLSWRDNSNRRETSRKFDKAREVNIKASDDEESNHST